MPWVCACVCLVIPRVRLTSEEPVPVLSWAKVCAGDWELEEDWTAMWAQGEMFPRGAATMSRA